MPLRVWIQQLRQVNSPEAFTLAGCALLLRKQINIRRTYAALCALVFLCSSVIGQAQDAPALSRDVELYYSQSNSAYQAVVDQMVTATVDQLTDNNFVATTFALSNNRIEAIRRLRASQNNLVIALGREAYVLAAQHVEPSRLIGVGVALGIDDPDTEATGLDLVPDARPAFETLRQLSPGTNRVVVIGRRGIDDEYLSRARREARRQGLELAIHYADDATDAASMVWNVLNYGNPVSDALWVTNGYSLLDERLVWPRLIEEAWSRQFFIFSNTLEHASLGAIFALYPSPENISTNIASIVVRKIAGEPVGVENITQVNRALNLRHARHQGLRIGERVVEDFDAVFGGDQP